MTQPSEEELRLFAVFDETEKLQATANGLLGELKDTLNTIKAIKKELSEQKEQANQAEKQRQAAFDAWQNEQARKIQEQAAQAEKDRQASFDKWKTEQLKAIETTQMAQGKQITNALSGFNQSATNIVNTLDSKVKTVNLTQQTIEKALKDGAAKAVNDAIGEQLRQSAGQVFADITFRLNQTDNLINATEQAAERVYKSFVTLENHTFDNLNKTIETQVAKGIEDGLTKGLAEKKGEVIQAMNEVTAHSKNSQTALLGELGEGVIQAKARIKKADDDLLNDIYSSRQTVVSNTNDCVKSLVTVKKTADAAVEDVKEYHDNLVNKGHWKWVIGFCLGVTLFMALANTIVYNVVTPSKDERNQLVSDIEQLQAQYRAISNSYVMQKTKLVDGKPYVLVDKSDCDGDYCKQREPSVGTYTTPSQQQVYTPPQATIKPQPQQSYQAPTTSYTPPSGNFSNGNNPYGTPKSSTNDNPFK